MVRSVHREPYEDTQFNISWLFFLGVALMSVIISVIFMSCNVEPAHAEENWKITSYCACKKCCGKSDAITASGKKAQYGMVACNWLKFGTKVKIEGLGVFVVADRGARSLFGDKNHKIRHLDVYLPTHSQARRFGVKYAKVEVLNVRAGL